MLKKKLLTKSAVSKKSAKPAKSTKPVTINYLASLHEVTKCIENDYSQLNKLLETTPAKLEKAIADVETKLKKAKEIQIKSEKLLIVEKKKPKAKFTAKSKQALAKSEKTLSEIKATTIALDAELNRLTEQLQTCKKMRNEYNVIEKSVKKVRADFEKKTLSKSKKIKKKPAKKKIVKAKSSSSSAKKAKADESAPKILELLPIE